MGREIRRVPPNYEAPTIDCRHYNSKSCGCVGGKGYQPQYDKYFEDAYDEWLKDFKRIKAGGLTMEEKKYYADFKEWIEENSPPDLAYYRAYRDEEATWYQVYQTVSEGSPVTPPFETQEELVNYLVKNGDFWDQKRGNRAYTKEEATGFVYGSGWVPSVVMTDGVLIEGIHCTPLLNKD